MGETSISCLGHVPQLGVEPPTQACALTRNQTWDPLLCGTAPNQLSHTGQGLWLLLILLLYTFTAISNTVKSPCMVLELSLHLK